MIEDKTLLAYLDGELDKRSAAMVEAAVAADPELARKLERHRRLRDVLHASFDPLLEQPLPPGLAAAVSRNKVVNIDTFRRPPKTGRPATNWTQWSAIAATLVAGVVGGYMIKPDAKPSGSGPIVERDGHIIAASDVAQALDTQLASAGTTGPVRVVLTFRNQQGEFCRSFEGKAASGVACRLGRDWRIAGFYPGDQTQHGDYRTAAAGDPRIMALVEDMIEGAPLDSSEERNARDSGWKAGLSLPAPG